MHLFIEIYGSMELIIFVPRNTYKRNYLFVGIWKQSNNNISSLLSCVMLVSSYFGWPVSTTHCIVGAMVGFGLVYGGPGAVFWGSLAKVTSSWIVSPLMGAAVSFLVYKCIRRFVYSAPNPGQAAEAAAPIAVFLGVSGISFADFPLSKSFPMAPAPALASGTAGAFLVDRIIRKKLGHLLVKTTSQQPEPTEDTAKKNLSFLSDVAGPKGTQLEIVYGVFGYMQVLSACFNFIYSWWKRCLQCHRSIGGCISHSSR